MTAYERRSVHRNEGDKGHSGRTVKIFEKLVYQWSSEINNKSSYDDMENQWKCVETTLTTIQNIFFAIQPLPMIPLKMTKVALVIWRIYENIYKQHSQHTKTLFWPYTFIVLEDQLDKHQEAANQGVNYMNQHPLLLSVHLEQN